ncbi:kelch-like protein diablo [Paramacrobiotus metropolitanus]|uniref:kelch-like protein diablo n=1 Tax=Paramacrobiotus metropolitanus TaxID=2943436 RepID=UPI0024460CB7|nr:kelch-like protein diablo [Paramacrobiotus metropolitanus]
MAATSSQKSCDAIIPNLPFRKTDPSGFFRELQNLRADEAFCDVVVKGCEAGAPGISCHRVILSAHSSYFRAAFASPSQAKESQNTCLQLHDISSNNLTQLINYAYTSEIALDWSNIPSLLPDAVHLEMDSIVDACWEFLESNLNVDTCLKTWGIADNSLHRRPRLAEQAKAVAVAYFAHVVKQPDFLQLDLDKVQELIGADDLYVEQEATVLEAVVDWLCYDSASRAEHFSQMLQYVRLLEVSAEKRLDMAARLLSVNANAAATVVERGLDEDDYEIEYRPRKSDTYRNVILCLGGVFPTHLQFVAPTASLAWDWCRPPEPISHIVIGTAACVNEDEMFLVGGYGSSSACLRYDLLCDEWQSVAPMPALNIPKLAGWLEGRLYGVDCSGERGTVYGYDPSTEAWHCVTRVSKPGLRHEVALIVGGRLYIFAQRDGGNGAEIDNVVLVYEFKKNTWTELPPMPTPRQWFAVCATPQGLIYVVGGHRKNNDRLSCVEAYNPATNQWTNKCDMQKPRVGAGICALNGKLFVLGGHNSRSTEYLRDIEVYDEVANSWTFHNSQLKTGKEVMSCVVFTVHRELLPVLSRRSYTAQAVLVDKEAL